MCRCFHGRTGLGTSVTVEGVMPFFAMHATSSGFCDHWDSSIGEGQGGVQVGAPQPSQMGSPARFRRPHHPQRSIPEASGMF